MGDSESYICRYYSLEEMAKTYHINEYDYEKYGKAFEEGGVIEVQMDHEAFLNHYKIIEEISTRIGPGGDYSSPQTQKYGCGGYNTIKLNAQMAKEEGVIRFPRIEEAYKKVKNINLPIEYGGFALKQPHLLYDPFFDILLRGTKYERLVEYQHNKMSVGMVIFQEGQFGTFTVEHWLKGAILDHQTFESPKEAFEKLKQKIKHYRLKTLFT